MEKVNITETADLIKEFEQLITDMLSDVSDNAEAEN